MRSTISGAKVLDLSRELKMLGYIVNPHHLHGYKHWDTADCRITGANRIAYDILTEGTNSKILVLVDLRPTACDQYTT